MHVQTQPRAGGAGLRKKLPGLILAGVLLAAALSKNRYFLGSAIVGLGLLSMFWALATSDQELRRTMARDRGPGWMIGWAMAKIPGAGAKVAFCLMCLGITGLGIAALAGL